MVEEEAWNKLIQDYSEFKVLSGIIEHTIDIEVKRYQKLGMSHDPDIDRYHHHVSFFGVDGRRVNIEAKSFNIKERIDYLWKIEGDQYCSLLVDIYSDFKRFIISKYGAGQEIGLLVKNDCTDVSHYSSGLNLFYVTTLAMVVRNKISHNAGDVSVDFLEREIRDLWRKEKYILGCEEENLFIRTLEVFTENNKVTLKRRVCPSGGHFSRIHFMVDCLLQYGHYIKNKT